MAPSLFRRSWRAQRRWVKNFDLFCQIFPIVEVSGCLEFLSHGQNGCSTSYNIILALQDEEDEEPKENEELKEEVL